ncbi:MAG TPA: hypothetical protein VGD36_01465 [Xanthobacteraceae bacterium]|jgi:hypothetical protein
MSITDVSGLHAFSQFRGSFAEPRQQAPRAAATEPQAHPEADHFDPPPPKETQMRTKLAGLSVAAMLMSITAASSQTFSKDCAAEDLRLTVAIEELGDAGTLPSDKLAAAYAAMLEARALCREGKITQAMGMYREVSLQSREAAVGGEFKQR